MAGLQRSAAKLSLCFALILSLAGCASFEFAPQDSSAPAHHGQKSFVNIPPKPAFTIWTQLRCMIGLEAPDPPAVDPALLPAVFKPETMEPDLARIRQSDPDAIQVTWIGHSTFLIQVDGLNILTDPVFSRRVSPVSFAGPVRLAPPGLDFKDLPAINAVLISHNYYDHMDKNTLQRLGNGPRTFVPLGHHRRLAGWGIFRVSELDWWQTSFLSSVLIHCVPARHNSNRGLFDIDRDLSIAMHWGTFPMSPAPPSEPPAYFRVALSKAGLSPSAFRLMKICQTLVLN